MTIDYKELLKKYMNHVVEHEGVTFLFDWGNYFAGFTESEWQELKKIESEATEEARERHSPKIKP